MNRETVIDIGPLIQMNFIINLSGLVYNQKSNQGYKANSTKKGNKLKKIDYKKRDQERLKKGIGDITHSPYIPWINISSSEAPSKGQKNSYYSRKMKRTIQCISKTEKYYGLLLEHRPDIVRYWDQAALADQRLTMQIADELGIRHPCYKHTSIPSIMTSDFIIEKDTGNGVVKAVREVKSENDLEIRRTIEKLEIGRQYWKRKGIDDYKIVTRNEIDNDTVIQLEHCADCRDTLEREFDSERLESLKTNYLSGFRSEDCKIWKFNDKFDQNNFLEPGTANMIFCLLCYEKKIGMDLKDLSNLNISCSEVEIC